MRGANVPVSVARNTSPTGANVGVDLIVTECLADLSEAVSYRDDVVERPALKSERSIASPIAL
jgi:hypothetical protein